MIVGTMIFWVASAYVWCGVAVAVAFLLFGLDRMDPAAKGAFGFRPLLVPGLTLLWPIVVVRWLRFAGGTKGA